MTSLLTPEKLKNLRTLTQRATHKCFGPVAELGVFRGGSAKAILESMQHWHPIYLFDTFQGLPETEPCDGPLMKAGMFKGALDEVMDTLRNFDPIQIHYEVGLFPESAYGCTHLSFCFVHVDVDIRASVQAACEWFSTRMSRGGIMLFDDFGCPQTPAAKPTVEAFFGERVVDLGTRQAMVQF